MRIKVKGEVAYLLINHKGEEMTAKVDLNNLFRILEISCTWSIAKVRNKYYVMYRSQYLHRLIKEAPKGTMIDHKDGDGLNNLEENLREVNNSENQQNRSKANKNNKSTGIRGITFNKKLGKYIAQIYPNGKTLYLGTFTDLEEAEKAVIKARSESMPFSEVDKRSSKKVSKIRRKIK